MSIREYVVGAELPDYTVSWYNASRELWDFSSGWTFTVKVWNASDSITKTTGITGAATAPNLTIAWATSAELSTLQAGEYTLEVKANRTSDGKDLVFRRRLSIIPAAP